MLSLYSQGLRRGTIELPTLVRYTTVRDIGHIELQTVGGRFPVESAVHPLSLSGHRGQDFHAWMPVHSIC
jgi:hypothetical protein